MVRLVFRPYAQIKRSICTSKPLRASIRVSPDFTLSKHRSPSFGSQQECSNSNPYFRKSKNRPMVPQDINTPLATLLLSLRISVFNTQILATLLDSLVRVSRRAVYKHFVLLVSQINHNLHRLTQKRIGRRISTTHTIQIDTITNQANTCFSTHTNSIRNINTDRKPFPFNDFRYSLTLFSKFFSSFPHGTCSLSVSRQYLALHGIYHQI